MSKALRFLFIVSCLFLYACQQANKEEPTINNKKKADLNKASSYNVQLGLGYLKQGDRPRAKKKFLTALSQAPNSPEVNSAIAYFFEQTNELEQAKKYYTKAISLSANSGPQLNNYGAFWCRQGEYKKAESYFLKAIKDEQYVHTAGAYENAGLCVLAIPDNEKAKLYFTNALSQDPSRRTSLYELVKLESKLGHDMEAFNLLQKYPDLVLNDAIFLSLAQDIANKAGKYEIAAKYEDNYKKLQNNTLSGVNNEYNSHNG